MGSDATKQIFRIFFLLVVSDLWLYRLFVMFHSVHVRSDFCSLPEEAVDTRLAVPAITGSLGFL